MDVDTGTFEAITDRLEHLAGKLRAWVLPDVFTAALTASLANAGVEVRETCVGARAGGYNHPATLAK